TPWSGGSVAGDWPNPSRFLHTGRLTVPTRGPLNGPEVPVEAKPCDRAKRHKPRRRVAEGTIGGLMRCWAILVWIDKTAEKSDLGLSQLACALLWRRRRAGSPSLPEPTCRASVRLVSSLDAVDRAPANRQRPAGQDGVSANLLHGRGRFPLQTANGLP